MRDRSRFPFVALAVAVLLLAPVARAQRKPSDPSWWNKYQFLTKNGPDLPSGPSVSLSSGSNVDVSNECGPQSETFITIDPSAPQHLGGGSNEIFRPPMRGYFSSDGGVTWGGVDLPLPRPIGANGLTFGSDPTLAFDTGGRLFYGYIVVYVGHGNGINGTQLAVARSTDGGETWPDVSFFGFEGGSNHFNDKPMIAADTNPASPFRDNVYLAWDAASGGSASGGVRLARSTDHGATFAATRIDDPTGPGRSIAADPFVGPGGELYVAWNDWAANTIAFNRSLDGGVTWGEPRVVVAKTAAFDVGIPAEFFRRALVYPACDTDRTAAGPQGPHRGRLYCSFMDLTSDGTTDIFLVTSDDGGTTWSAPAPVTDEHSFPTDRFNQWLSVDPKTGDVNVSFYDTRNDTTGHRYETDIYLARSADGGQSFGPNVRVTNKSSNEHDCGGLFPCPAINYGNQQGDYSGLVALDGAAYPIWTDSRRNREVATGCRTHLTMEEVFTAVVK